MTPPPCRPEAKPAIASNRSDIQHEMQRSYIDYAIERDRRPRIAGGS